MSLGCFLSYFPSFVYLFCHFWPGTSVSRNLILRSRRPYPAAFLAWLSLVVRLSDRTYTVSVCIFPSVFWISITSLGCRIFILNAGHGAALCPLARHSKSCPRWLSPRLLPAVIQGTQQVRRKCAVGVRYLSATLLSVLHCLTHASTRSIFDSISSEVLLVSSTMMFSS